MHEKMRKGRKEVKKENWNSHVVRSLSVIACI